MSPIEFAGNVRVENSTNVQLGHVTNYHGPITMHVAYPASTERPDEDVAPRLKTDDSEQTPIPWWRLRRRYLWLLAAICLVLLSSLIIALTVVTESHSKDFLCRDSAKWIDKSQVCNRKPDCTNEVDGKVVEDKSDEQPALCTGLDIQHGENVTVTVPFTDDYENLWINICNKMFSCSRFVLFGFAQNRTMRSDSWVKCDQYMHLCQYQGSVGASWKRNQEFKVPNSNVKLAIHLDGVHMTVWPAGHWELRGSASMPPGAHRLWISAQNCIRLPYSVQTSSAQIDRSGDTELTFCHDHYHIIGKT